MEDEEADENNDNNDKPDDSNAMDEDAAPPRITQSSPTRRQQSPAGQLVPSSAPQPKEKPKKVVISYDRYQSMKSLIQLHLQEAERDLGTGVARDQLKSWYLEQREADINNMEELEEEQLLFDKVLKKLVKVRRAYLLLLHLLTVSLARRRRS